MKQILCFSVVFLAANMVSSFVYAITLKCDDGVVRMNDSKYEIVHKCGEPTFKDFSKVTRISEETDEVLQKFITVEDWLYNFGPKRHVAVLTFENNKLVGMRSFGYGRSASATPDYNKKIDIGDPTVRLLFLFGPPSYKEERVDTKVVSHKGSVALPEQKTVATWTYNLGPNYLLRIYHFVNGRLVQMETGDRGF